METENRQEKIRDFIKSVEDEIRQSQELKYFVGRGFPLISYSVSTGEFPIYDEASEKTETSDEKPPLIYTCSTAAICSEGLFAALKKRYPICSTVIEAGNPLPLILIESVIKGETAAEKLKDNFLRLRFPVCDRELEDNLHRFMVALCENEDPASSIFKINDVDFHSEPVFYESEPVGIIVSVTLPPQLKTLDLLRLNKEIPGKIPNNTVNTSKQINAKPELFLVPHFPKEISPSVVGELLHYREAKSKLLEIIKITEDVDTLLAIFQEDKTFAEAVKERLKELYPKDISVEPTETLYKLLMQPMPEKRWTDKVALSQELKPLQESQVQIPVEPITSKIAELEAIQQRSAKESQEVLQTTDVRLLYSVWDADKEKKYSSYISDHLKTLLPNIPKESHPYFCRKTNAAKTKYLMVRWDKGSTVEPGEITVAKYQEDGTLKFYDPSTWEGKADLRKKNTSKAV